MLKNCGPKNPFLVALPKVPAAGRFQGPRVQPLALSKAVGAAVLRQPCPLVPGGATANQPAAEGLEMPGSPTRFGRHGPVSTSLRFCCKPEAWVWYGESVSQKRPALFRGRHFEDVVILLCVRWYLRYSLSYRDLQEMMAERGLSVDHVTIWRWVQRYAPVLINGFALSCGDRIVSGGSMRPT